MNHYRISVLKSMLRILTCVIGIVFAVTNLIIAAICVLGSGLVLAEFLGILEEIYDKRKE